MYGSFTRCNAGVTSGKAGIQGKRPRFWMAQATKNRKGKKRESSASAKTKSAASTAKKGVRKASNDVATPIDAAANAALAGKAAVAAARATGKAASLAASRARMPLIAGGSAAAGLVGGLAVIRRRRNRK